MRKLVTFMGTAVLIAVVVGCNRTSVKLILPPASRRVTANVIEVPVPNNATHHQNWLLAKTFPNGFVVLITCNSKIAEKLVVGDKGQDITLSGVKYVVSDIEVNTNDISGLVTLQAQ